MISYKTYKVTTEVWICPYCRYSDEVNDQSEQEYNEHLTKCTTNPNNQVCGSCVNHTPANYFKKCKRDVNGIDAMLLTIRLEKCSLWQCKKSLIKYIDSATAPLTKTGA